MSKQPKPPSVDVPFSGDGRALYSHMSLGELMRLRRYMDDLIKWKKGAGPVDILYAIIEEKRGETE